MTFSTPDGAADMMSPIDQGTIMTTTPVRPVTQSATVRAPVRHEGKPSTIGGGGDSLPDLPTTTYSVHRRAFFDARPSFCHITLTQPVLANLSIVSVPGTGPVPRRTVRFKATMGS